MWWLVNPNDYKGRIAEAVKESTGRDLALTGDIKLSVFPWIALQLGPASLGNPPGFGEEPFLAFNRASVRVKLFPLLAKRLEMDRVEVDGLDLRLRKNAQGAGNWEGPWAEAAPPQPELAGIQITHGRVSYQGIVVEKFNLETGAFGGHGVTPVSISFAANRGVPDESLTLSAKFDLSADAAAKRLRLAAVSFSGLRGPRRERWRAGALGDVGAFDRGGPQGSDGGGAGICGELLERASQRQTAGHENSRRFGRDGLGGAGTAGVGRVRAALRRGAAEDPRPKALAQLAASSDFDYGASGVKLAASCRSRSTTRTCREASR